MSVSTLSAIPSLTSAPRSLPSSPQGKDEQHLCTLTAFDFYLVTKIPAKAPKGSYFALKSRAFLRARSLPSRAVP